MPSLAPTASAVRRLSPVSITTLRPRPRSAETAALDSGLTLSYIKELLASRGPASIKIATLLDKPSRRKVDLVADYIGFSVPDEFVIGYGLDYDEKYRNLPYIGILKPEVYSV